MISALWTGIAGLAAQQTALDNESNNIANVNTVGYKASRVSFADLMYQDSIGKGSAITSAEKQYTQGSLNLTGSSYDVALDGDGFFVVSNTSSKGTSEFYYTRAGNLVQAKSDFKNAYLLNPYNRNVINDLASSYVNINQLDSAKYFYIKASRISPRFDDPKLNLAAVYFNEKEFKKADSCLQTLLHDSERRTKYQTLINAFLGKK